MTSSCYSSCPSSEQSRLAIAIRRYQIREKILSVGDQFKIKDELGHDMFIVKSKLLSIGDNLILEDTNGNAIIKIRQEVLHLLPTFRIISAIDGDSERSLAHIKQNFTLLHKKFTINSIYGQYTLDALDILAHSFTLTKEDRTVAAIDKKYFAMANTYSIEIAENENQAFVLALVIVINQILCTFHWQALTVLK